MRYLVILICLWASLPPKAMAETAPPSGWLHIDLPGAAYRAISTERSLSPAIVLSIPIVEGKVLGGARAESQGYNRSHAAVTVSNFGMAAGQATCTVAVKLGDDPWVKGGAGTYQLDLNVAADQVTGTYTGQFQQAEGEPQARSGRVSGLRVPFWPELRERVKFAPQEHPRLLLRKGDLDELRRRAATPQGQKIVEHLRLMLPQANRGFTWSKASSRTPLAERSAKKYTEGYYCLGEALMFLLTEKKEHLDRAKFRMLDAMTFRDGEAGGWGTAPRIAGVANAWDLLYDHLEPEFRAKFLGYFERPTPKDTHDTQLRYEHRGAETFEMMFSSASVLCDLVSLGEPVPEPAKPPASGAVPAIAPVADLVVGEGVPVVPYTSGTMPRSTLVLGTFRDADGDPLKDLGGPANCRPDLTTTIRGQQARVKGSTAISYGHIYRGHPAIAVDLRTWPSPPGIGRRSEPCTIYLYVVLENDAERIVKAQTDLPDVSVGNRMWLAGQELKHGQIVRLAKGRYPMMLAIPARGTFASPNLVDCDLNAETNAWRARHALWLADGKTMPGATLRLAQRRDYLRLAVDRMIGERGYISEITGHTNMRVKLLVAAQAYRNLFGQDFTPGSGLAWCLPLNLHMNGAYWGNDWGGAYWPVFAFADVFPAEYRPAQRQVMDESFIRMRADEPDTGTFLAQPRDHLYALLNYPWNTPAQPRDQWKLPLVYQDRKRGMIIQRNGWTTDSCMVATTLQTDALPTCHSMGTVLIDAFGDRVIGYQEIGGGTFTPIRLTADKYPRGTPRNIGDVPCYPKGGGQLIHEAFDADGSGTFSFRCDKWMEFGKPAKPVDGMRYLRAMAVDYSGASGSPALIVFVDRLEGHGERPVRWIVPTDFSFRWSGAKPLGGAAKAAPGSLQPGVTYSVVRSTGKDKPTPDAPGLGATFIGPDEMAISYSSGRKSNALSSSKAAWWMVVLTLQRGQPPMVALKGAGLETEVTVGKRVIRFDGEKLVMTRQ